MGNELVYQKMRDKEKLLFYVPSTMEQELIYKYYNEFGHFGRQNSRSIARKLLISKYEKENSDSYEIASSASSFQNFRVRRKDLFTVFRKKKYHLR